MYSIEISGGSMLKKIFLLSIVIALLVGCSKKQPEPQQNAVAKIETRNFTLPSFADLFNSLDYLQKPDFDKALAKEYKSNPNDVFIASFDLGKLTADAIIATKSRNKTKLSEIANAMIENSKLIGVKEDVLKLADELITLIQTDKWEDLQSALDKYKNQVENSLYETQQFDLLTLVQTGGWTQGLNRLSFLISANYKEDKTQVLNQKGILVNVVTNFSKIENTEIINKPWFKTIQNNYSEIQKIIKPIEKQTFSSDDINKLIKLSQSIIESVK